MRLWSLHPRYLDAVGLVACWRESLLAQKVLAGATAGYRRHPQLERFRDHPTGIASYLHALADEADDRAYRFDRSRIAGSPDPDLRLTVTTGQLAHERGHLLAKLRRRSPERVDALASEHDVRPHPLFDVVEGDIEPWERVTDDRPPEDDGELRPSAPGTGPRLDATTPGRA